MLNTTLLLVDVTEKSDIKTAPPSSLTCFRPWVEDIKTQKAETNDPLLPNWILEPGDENQKNREREKEGNWRDRMREGGRVGEACYFTAVWEIWLTRGCPTLQETSNSRERERQTRAMAWGWLVEDVENWRGRRSEQSPGFVCQVVQCGGSSHISAFTEQIKSLHEICLLAQHIKVSVILTWTGLKAGFVFNYEEKNVHSVRMDHDVATASGGNLVFST